MGYMPRHEEPDGRALLSTDAASGGIAIMNKKGNDVKAEVFLPDDYRPAEDEPFMNERQLEYFRRKLLNWKAELMGDSKSTIETLQDSTRNIPDIADRASEETDRALELRTRDRERKLIRKIGKTLDRVDDEDYGWCDQCGIEIGVRRLEARPTADLCIDCKTLDEIREKQTKA